MNQKFIGKELKENLKTEKTEKVGTREDTCEAVMATHEEIDNHH